MQKGRSWFFRAQGPVNTAIQANDLWPLPEAIAKAVLLEQRRQSRVLACFQVIEVHAPGDATVQLAFQETSQWYRVSIIGPHNVRVLVRKNFPAESQSTILFVPISSTLKSLATALTAALHPHLPNALTITQVYALPRGADPLSSTFVWSGFPALQSIAQWTQCGLLTYSRTLSENHYIVLTLKKCASGSPLLPQSIEAVARNSNDWTRLSYEEFELTSYLRSFLLTIGARVGAFDQLYGQRLAPYMSAVSRDEWNLNYSHIQTWLKTAGLAYKIHTGSSSGPKIMDAARPRFVESVLPGPGYSRELTEIQGASSSSGFSALEFGMHFEI